MVTNAALAASRTCKDFMDGLPPKTARRWSILWWLGKQALQVSRILDRVTADIVVEIGPGRAAPIALRRQPLRPFTHLVVGIAAAIFSARSVKPDISGASACPARGF